MRKRDLLRLFILIFFIPRVVIAAEDLPVMPRDMDMVDFYLQTVDAGTDVYTAFGHSVLRVVDRLAGSDMVYNWGVFYFDDPRFLFNFFYGDVAYQMDDFDIETNLETYRYEKRSIIQNKFNFTKQQKERLFARIIENARPENRFFVYKYYTANCATKLRDTLDHALSGALGARFRQSQSMETVRQAARPHFAIIPLIGLFADIVGNSQLDVPLTEWQAMFLPATLQQKLAAMRAVNDDGSAVPSRSLLEQDEAILTFSPVASSPLSGFQCTFLAFMLPLLFSGALLFFSKARLIGMRLLGFLVSAWGILAGTMGLAMLVLWIFTLHKETYHSANLFLFWPTDFLWVPMGLTLLFRGRFPSGPSSAHVFNVYFAAHGFAALALLGLSQSGLIAQDVDQTIWYLVPITIFISFLLWRRSHLNDG